MKLNTGDRNQWRRQFHHRRTFRLMPQRHKIKKEGRSGCTVFFVNTLIKAQKKKKLLLHSKRVKAIA
jgi:hypothetical protein